jgi:hypothetical protein
MPAEKIDLYKLHKDEYASPKKPILVTIGPAKYLTVPGAGKPGSEEFQARIGNLYSMAFTIKMTRKFEGKQDYAVCKLEGIYWEKKGSPKGHWNWKLLIRTPDFIQQEDLDDAVERLRSKGKGEGTDTVKLETIEEGPCVQVLHVGPYDAEQETIARMEEFAKEQGYSFHGPHHEIYLSDPRRVPPERLKTILRHPVGK